MRLISKLLPGRATAFRLWALASAAWLLSVVAVEAPAVRDAAVRHAEAQAMADGRAPIGDLPLLCAASRGLPYVDHQIRPAVPDGPKFCWFEPADFRRLYPEYAGVADHDLYFATLQKTGLPATPVAAGAHLGDRLARAGRRALLPPAGLGAAMVLFGWWLRGGPRPRRYAGRSLTPHRPTAP
jgi:hypothetical protein